MTLHEDTLRWLERGNDMGATHVLVLCDTIEWRYYPAFVMTGEDARKCVDEKSAQERTILTGLYKLSEDWQTQLSQHRPFTL